MTMLTVAAWVGVIVVMSTIFGIAAPLVARKAPARAATWLLSAGSLLVAASAVAIPAVYVLIAAGQQATVASLGGWSPVPLSRSIPLHNLLAAVPVAVLGVQLGALGVVAGRQVRRLRGFQRVVRGANLSLLVLPDVRPLAFAVPGLPGHVVASQGLFQRLDSRERRAVLAHERAHLRHHHAWHRGVASAAASVNPLLRGVPAAVRLATERWADDCAAEIIGDRRLVAAAIGRVAEPSPTPAPPTQPNGAARPADVVVRASALLATAPARTTAWTVVVLAIASAAVALTLSGLYRTNQLFEAAEAYRPHLTH